MPQLGATLFTRRQDIFEQEKRIETFSSDQPGGLMTVLMGENMMRKDGAAKIDAAIDARIPDLTSTPDLTLISVQIQAGLPMESLKANVKLAISGGQNEPRDAIAGTIWALLTHPDQLQLIQNGQATWCDAFE